MNKNTTQWYDNWESGWRINKKNNKMIYYFKLPNGRGDCTKIEFEEGDKNWEKMRALHSFAESALTELGKNELNR